LPVATLVMGDVGDARVAANQGVYSSRINQYLDPVNRIQDCMQRSMNAQTNVLDRNSYEMQSMVSYLKWLTTGVQWADMGGPVTDWKQVKAQSFLPVSGMTRPTDPVRGKTVYEEQCAACHGSDGEGVWDANNQVFIYPAVWGPRSFNDGAGMYRPRTAVGFVKGIMPYGWANATDATHQLSAEDAWDAITYVVYQNRPQWWNRENDWNCIPVGNRTCLNSVNGVSYGPDGVPDWMRKLVDAGYPVYYPRLNGSQYTCNTAYPQYYSEAKHLYGPWSDMITLQNKIISDFKAGLQPACP
ncbi:MAG: c-type cytochrome, partial [Pseudomonadota bacterium]